MAISEAIHDMIGPDVPVAVGLPGGDLKFSRRISFSFLACDARKSYKLQVIVSVWACVIWLNDDSARGMYQVEKSEEDQNGVFCLILVSSHLGLGANRVTEMKCGVRAMATRAEGRGMR